MVKFLFVRESNRSFRHPRYTNAEPLKASLGERLATFEAKTGGHRVAPFADALLAFVDTQREEFIHQEEEEGHMEI